jgi:hypothetical protein
MISIRSLVAISFAAIAAQVSAAPVLNFEGSQDGALIQNFYNGGTDSLGNVGTNYGVTFVGGVVHVVNGLTYLTGVSSVTFAAGNANGLSFNYSTIQTAYNSSSLPVTDPGINDFTISIFDKNKSIIEQEYLGNTTSGQCTSFTGQFCLFNGAGYSFPADLLVGGFSFSTSAAIDTISFGNSLPPANEIASAAVPEPSAIALLALGLVGFGFTRRRKSL